jgi:hypothetical protein
VDLHLYQHPLIHRKKLDPVNLEALGFSESELGSLPTERPFLYVNFRSEKGDFKVVADVFLYFLTT